MSAEHEDVVQPRTEWFQRVTGRLLALSPQMLPLDAMRHAMTAFPDSQHDDPERVATGLLGRAQSQLQQRRDERSRSA